jgi:hypothetical protein
MYSGQERGFGFPVRERTIVEETKIEVIASFTVNPVSSFCAVFKLVFPYMRNNLKKP